MLNWNKQGRKEIIEIKMAVRCNCVHLKKYNKF
jgi:hypothetical protein